MANPNDMMDDELEFENMMKEHFDESSMSEGSGSAFTDERLKEMNKKLPNWDLEPPFNFLK